ncbi:hypothetical protein [Thiomonas sp.]
MHRATAAARLARQLPGMLWATPYSVLGLLLALPACALGISPVCWDMQARKIPPLRRVDCL